MHTSLIRITIAYQDQDGFISLNDLVASCTFLELEIPEESAKELLERVSRTGKSGSQQTRGGKSGFPQKLQIQSSKAAI